LSAKAAWASVVAMTNSMPELFDRLADRYD